jgi:hypothetical protein
VARIAALAQTFGLAALPLFAFGAVGLWTVIRSPSSGRERATLRFLHVPALVYLTAVFGLVAVGAYTGSHRYLYPALPALALLAAAALDRHASTVRVIAVAATALLAVAFLPVFTNFATDNAGLVAAGRASGGSSGLLITDSPVVAFYSGRLPTDIAGSQQLPLDRAGATAWMQGHGVTELVIENISYYRATVVFPDLASGQASPPFRPHGVQSGYQVYGGKPIYAYRVEQPLTTQVYPGVDATLAPTAGQGKTAGLAKGVTLKVVNADVRGEGMGFGVPIVHYNDGWVYSRSSATVDLSTASSTVWKRTFQLDEIGGDAAHGYSFVPVASRGAIEVTYTVDATGIHVSVHVVRLAPGYSEVGILNEGSAAFNDFASADRSSPLIDSQFGNWVPVVGSWARLQSKSLGVQWSLPSIAGAQLHAGRELITPDFNWAGLDYLFPPSFTGTSYHINVLEAR